MKPKILFIQPLTTLLDTKKDKPTPPFGILSAIRHLPKEFEIEILDQRLATNFKDELEKRLKSEQLPTFVGLSVIAGPMVKYALEISDLIKKLNTHLPVVWGGPHSFIAGELAIKDPRIDVVACGEGEETIVDLASALAVGGALFKVAGLYIKEGDETFFTGARELVELNGLPPVSYKPVGSRYFYPSLGRPTAFFETSRGCPYRCAFCYQSTQNFSWRAASAQWVKDALEFLLKENPQVKHLYVADDNYFFDKERALEIASNLLNAGYDLTYQIQGASLSDLARFSFEELRTLGKSGCVRVDIGAETGSERIARMINKPSNVEKLFEVAKNLSEAGIIPWVNFMVGFPGETASDLKATLISVNRLLREVPDVLLSPVYTYYPYPQTALYERALQLGFKPPENIADLSRASWNSPVTPWVKNGEKKLFENLYFYSIFVDRKIEYYRTGVGTKILSRLFRPIARFRLKYGFFFFPVEKWLFKLVYGGEY